MKVEVENVKGVHVVTVVGEMDLLTSVVFFNRVVEIRSETGTRIALDLRGLTYLDSMGAGQLWRTVQTARSQGGDAVLVGVPATVRRTLDLVGISAEVAFTDTVEDAVARLSKPVKPAG